MGTTYAFVVDCPAAFGKKKVFLAGTIEAALKAVRAELRNYGKEYVEIESIVNAGEVVNLNA